jgi:tRNA A58 N-methylase Trm61
MERPHLLKLLKAGDVNRTSRIHTLRGQLIPVSEIFTIPLELVMRILHLRRQGPWLSKPAIRLLAQLMSERYPARVLEIGGGSSSKFFANKAGSLLTIEEDKEWARKIIDIVGTKNCEFEIIVTDVESWLNTRNESNMEFDLVLIDGSTDVVRKKVLEKLPTLNSGAVYILDNSDRTIFNKIDFVFEPTRILRKHGLVRQPFQATETTFFWFK